MRCCIDEGGGWIVVTISEALSSVEVAIGRGFGWRREGLDDAREAAVILGPAAAAAAPEGAPVAPVLACPEACDLPLAFRGCDEDGGADVDDEDEGPALEAAGAGLCCCCSPGSRPFAAALRCAFAAFAAAFASLPDDLAASPAGACLGSDMLLCVAAEGNL